MKQSSAIFLQGVIVLTGIGVLAIMIRLPLTEGRAVNLDLFSIYTDPFILYCYAASIPFFMVLYKVFKLLGYIGQKKALSQITMKTIRDIKFYSILLNILIVIAGIFILIFHNKDDDPAGFLSLCLVFTIIIILFVIAVAVFEKILKNILEKKSKYEKLF